MSARKVKAVRAAKAWALYWPDTGSIDPTTVRAWRFSVENLGLGNWRPIRVEIRPLKPRARRKA